MTPEQLSEIRARHAAARPGPYCIDLGNEVEVCAADGSLGGTVDQPSWDLLERAWEDIGLLLAHQQDSGRAAGLREALEIAKDEEFARPVVAAIEARLAEVEGGSKP